MEKDTKDQVDLEPIDPTKIPLSGGVLSDKPTDQEEDESPKEETMYKSDKISIKYEDGESVKGTIEITTKVLKWTNAGADNTIYIPYNDFVLHAIIDPEENCIALYFIPEDESELDKIFDSFSECSSLNPDPTEDAKESDNMYSNFDFFDINNIDQLQIDDGDRFEDADEEDPGNTAN